MGNSLLKEKKKEKFLSLRKSTIIFETFFVGRGRSDVGFRSFEGKIIKQNLTEQTAISNGYEFTRKSLMIAEKRDAFDELQSVNDVSEDSREEGHITQ